MSPSKKIVEVVIPTGIGKTLHYSVPPAFEPRIQAGMRVRVPLGPRQATGYVVDWVKTAEVLTLRDILEVLDATPLLDQWLLDFTRWAADYYLAPWGRLLQYAVPPIAQRKDRRAIQIPPPPEQAQELRAAYRPDRPGSEQLATEEIVAAVRAGLYKVFLLRAHSRLAVYLKAIDTTLKTGKSCLLLVPEILQIEPIATQLKLMLGLDPLIIHGELNPRKRLDNWLKIKASKNSVVIGTRSAVFAPISNLGLIIVDEEQDISYKQEESPRYHARDLSLVRARGSGAAVLLGSAAPSMESYYHVQTGKYHGLRLHEEAWHSPAVEIVDLREAPRSGFVSEPLKKAVVRHVAKGDSIALFINRRGFAHGIFCRDCGYTARCPSCNIAAAYHKETRQLRCHYCGRIQPPIDSCPDCRGARLIAVGSGTERVFEEVKTVLPEARIERLDRDLIGGKKKRREVAARLAETRAEVFIGTQLLLSWSELPTFSLIGLVWADQGLHLPDFRAGERTFQLLTLLMQRSKEEVLIQTYTPDHPAIQFAAQRDYAGFAQTELETRKALGLPPYRRLIRLVVNGRREGPVQRAAESLAAILHRMAGEKDRTGEDKGRFDILGPVPAPVSKRRSRYRWHLLLRGRDPGPLHHWAAAGIQAWTNKNPATGIKLEIDVDPLQML